MYNLLLFSKVDDLYINLLGVLIEKRCINSPLKLN